MFSEIRSIQFKAPRLGREYCFCLGFKCWRPSTFWREETCAHQVFPTQSCEIAREKQVAHYSISPHNFNISKINIMYKNKICWTFLPLFTVPLTICDDQWNWVQFTKHKNLSEYRLSSWHNVIGFFQLEMTRNLTFCDVIFITYKATVAYKSCNFSER